MRSSVLTKTLCIISVLLSLAACGARDEQPAKSDTGSAAKPSRARKPHIALIMKAISNPFFKTMAEGATRKAPELDIKLTCLSVPRETDFEQQAGLVEQMVAQNVAEVTWHKTQQLTFRKDGTLDFRATVSGLGEISWWVLGYGDQAEVLEPAKLRRLVADRAARMARCYQARKRSSTMD